MIYKKAFFLEYTIDQLLNANIYLGYHKKISNNSMFKYLAGTRSQITIINLSYTILWLKKICNFTQQVFNNFGYLWIVDTLNIENTFIKFIDYMAFLEENHCRVSLWKNFWYPGTLTNFAEVFKNTTINWYHMYFPSAVFFLNSTVFYSAVLEPSKIKMPSLSIIDSNNDTNMVTYLIPGNEKSIKALYFYYKIFLKIVLRNKILEKCYFSLSIKKAKRT